ncbi:unnamed protein product [Choristocarpus tenellus]
MKPSLLEEAYMHIDAARRNGTGCLVHCEKGTSRSCSLVLGYLMQLGEGMSLLAALEFCQGKRRQCHPDKFFLQKLSEYEDILYGQTTVSLHNYHRGDLADSLAVTNNAESPGEVATVASSIGASYDCVWSGEGRVSLEAIDPPGVDASELMMERIQPKSDGDPMDVSGMTNSA